MRLVPTCLVLVSAAATVAGCGGSDSQGAGGERVAVVATTMQLQDLARQVGGDRVEVTGILGPDSEPHEYEPTPSDAQALTDADVVIENGAGLDDWLGDLLSTSGTSARRVDASEGIDLLPTEEEGFPGDPHVWHDPSNAKRMVDAVAAGLAAADPGGRRAYARNAARYQRRIDDMARQIRRTFDPIPPARRQLITTHDAFGYFVRAYDITQVGTVLPALTTETEPSGEQVRELVETIRDEDVGTIFTEEAVDPKLERRIADEAGAEVSTSLYADVLGGPGSGAQTLVDSELANARAMARAWSR